MTLRKVRFYYIESAIECLSEALAINESLKYLNLSSNELGISNKQRYGIENYPEFINEEDVLPIEVLKKGIIANRSIHELDLSINDFCNKERTLGALAV